MQHFNSYPGRLTNALLEFLGDVFKLLEGGRNTGPQGMSLESVSEGCDGGDVDGEDLDGGHGVLGEPRLGVEARL